MVKVTEVKSKADYKLFETVAEKNPPRRSLLYSSFSGKRCEIDFTEKPFYSPRRHCELRSVEKR
jgi:hypothetical protein